jgi:hypothetical protein
MFFSAAFEIAKIGGKPRMAKTTLCIDLFLAAFLFSILLPRLVDRPLFHAIAHDC